MKKFLVSAVGDTRMLSFFCTVIFEDMAGLLEKSDRIEINWVSNDIDLRDYDDSYWIEKQEDETDAEFAARESNPNKRNLAPKDSTFLGQIAPTDLHTEILTAEIVGARWGIEMFPIAKNVSVASLDAYTVNRPRAICGALYLTDEQAELMNGDEFKPVYKTLRAFLTCSSGRESAHRISLSQYMTGEVEAVMRRSGEARRERRKKFCLRVCFAYLLVCFRVSFAAVTVSPFLLSFSSLGHSPRAPCRSIK
jgi:hypothetical protein